MTTFGATKRIACVLLLAASGAAMAIAGPNTEAQAALGQILIATNADGEVLDNLFHRFPDAPVPRAKRIDYSRWLTRHLLDALAAEQKKLVQSDCGGVYQKDEICGMESNPLTCSQDDIGKPKLIVVKQDTVSATLRDRDGDRYEMVRDGGVWKLDGVKCHGE